MSNFKNEPYLRILTPRTNDGINPTYDSNKQPTYKESHLPMSALKAMEKENMNLPAHLKHVIEKVGLPEETTIEQSARDFKPQRVPRSNPKPVTK